jgi:RNA ligase (TIGR02306 family)
MERKLASLQEIKEVLPIEGADRIVLVKVLGWQCVTQKSNNFVPGSKVIYFEVDSLLPAEPLFEFLRKKPEETKFRLRTIKLKGHFSQGLVLPAELFDEHPAVKAAQVGDDLTEALGVEKYEPEIPAQLRGIVAGNFPSFVSKTDETRIQAYPQLLETYKGTEVFFTEKLDGSSITVFYVPRILSGIPHKLVENCEDENIFGVCSRNLPVLEAEDNSYWKAVNTINLREKLKDYNKPIVLQGELIGPGVQGNKLQLRDLEIRWFNVADPMTREFYGFEDFHKTTQEIDLATAPVLAMGKLEHTVDDLVKMAIGPSTLNSKVAREGIVCRPLVEQEIHKFGRFSFKVINPEFLVKYGE